MKAPVFITIAAAACFAACGCGADTKMSPGDEASVKAGFQQQGLDMSKLTPEQKAGLEKWQHSDNKGAPPQAVKGQPGAQTTP
jgi:hypothetical protein